MPKFFAIICKREFFEQKYRSDVKPLQKVELIKGSGQIYQEKTTPQG